MAAVYQSAVTEAEETDQLTRLCRNGVEGPLWFSLPNGSNVLMDGWYAGRACFLICGGPSLADTNLDLLRRPGVVTWGMNQSWALFRPRFWTCVDPPGKFHDRGWRDPTITKVVPLALANHRLRVRTDKGFRNSQFRVADMPSVLFWQRNSRFNPAFFLGEPSVCWGNTEGVVDPIGVSGIRSVMLASMRLVHAFGFRTVYLVGCDFKMEKASPYAFAQDRRQGAINHNNRLYAAVGKRLEALKPYFEFAGLRVFNCNPTSALEAFPFKRISVAVEEATRDCGGEMDTRGWYENMDKPKPESDGLDAYRHGGGD